MLDSVYSIIISAVNKIVNASIPDFVILVENNSQAVNISIYDQCNSLNYMVKKEQTLDTTTYVRELTNK